MHLSFQRSHYLLLKVIVGIIFSFFLFLFNTTDVNAQTPTTTDTLIGYSLTEACQLTVYFPYDLSEDWQNVWGTSNAIIAGYGGVHPSLLNPLGFKTGYTNFTIGDWVSEFNQGYNGGQDADISYLSSSATWSDISPIGSGSYYWYWSFPDGQKFYAQFYVNGDDTCVPYSNSDPFEIPSYFSITDVLLQTSINNLTVNNPTTSTARVKVFYYVDPDEYATTSRLTNATDIRVCLTNSVGTQICDINNIQNGEIPESGDRYVEFQSLQADSYIAKATFWNDFAEADYLNGVAESEIIRPFPYAEATIRFVMTLTGDVTSVGDVSINNLSQGSPYAQCGISNIGGCLQNVLVWLFYPTWSVDIFTGVMDSLEDKVPFAYVYGVLDHVESMEGGSGTLPVLAVQPFDDFAEITLMDPNWFDQEPWLTLFSYIRNMTKIVILVTMVLVLYRRTRAYVNSFVGMHMGYEVFTGSGKKN